MIRNDSPSRLWAETLEAVSAELKLLNRNTEGEFLRIGAKVSEFIDTISLLSSDLASLGDLVSGQQGQQASDALSGALQLSEEMRHRSAGSNQLLGNMKTEARSLKKILSHFNGTVATFHSLGLLTRIETARLGDLGADFGNLAEDVRLLARNVQTRVESALDTAGELIPQIDTALQDAFELHGNLDQNLPSVIAQALESLSSFREMQASACAASTRLAASYADISEAFKRLITSMQFNDITRQQVEHVITVLHRLTAPAVNDERRRLLIEFSGSSNVLDLQWSLMENASTQFSGSVDAVLLTLEEIAVNVLSMTQESRALSHLSGSGRKSFFHQMEQGCTAILETLCQCASTDEASAATTANLAVTTSRMRASIQEIRTIETQMLRIGMNARISADHLGNAGEALSALADSIKQRAFESREGSDLLLKTLDVLSDLANASTTHARTGNEDQDDRDKRLEEIRSAVDVLRLSQESSTAHVARILARGEVLHRDIGAILAGFSAADVFSATINRARKKVKEISTQVQFTIPTTDNPEDTLNLAEFAGHYTMNAERHIHLKAAHLPIASTPNTTSETAVLSRT